MSEKFSSEPVVGHGVSAEKYEYESRLTEQLDAIAEENGNAPRNRKRVKITVGDVSWDESKEVTMDANVFEEIIEWYEESR